MIIFKFTKTSTAALVSHVDNLRAVTYLLRRAGVNALYSMGFNPHMELGFSAPIALGVESLAEYVSVKTDEQSFPLEQLNLCSPVGLTFVAQWNASVNLAAVLDRAQYRLQAKKIGNVINEILTPNYCISYLERDKEVVKDVSNRIFSAERVDDDSALVTLAIGNDNLRPDRLVLHLMNKHGLDGDYRITKLAAFAGDVPADEYIASHNILS